MLVLLIMSSVMCNECEFFELDSDVHRCLCHGSAVVYSFMVASCDSVWCVEDCGEQGEDNDLQTSVHSNQCPSPSANRFVDVALTAEVKAQSKIAAGSWKWDTLEEKTTVLVSVERSEGVIDAVVNEWESDPSL